MDLEEKLKSGQDRARDRLPRVPRQQRARGRRKSAMALYRALRRARIMGRECRPKRDRLGRRMGAVSGAGMIDQAAAARATQEVPSIPRDVDGPVFRDAMGGAGVRDDAGAT